MQSDHQMVVSFFFLSLHVYRHWFNWMELINFYFLDKWELDLGMCSMITIHENYFPSKKLKCLINRLKANPD